MQKKLTPNQKKLSIILLLIGIGFVLFLSGVFTDTKVAPIQIPEETVSKVPESEEKSATTKPFSEVSFQHLVERSYQAPALTLGTVIQTTALYTKRNVTYKSDEYTISGVLYTPIGAAPENGYPVLITNHGHIDLAVYTTGRGLKREQEYFASRGYVVMHPDYRNHAGSSKTGNDPLQDRLGYITDIIHAVESLKNSTVNIDKQNITLLGHSMGGGATLAAALIKPDVGARIVLYAPVTVNYLDSYLRYQSKDPGRGERIRTTYGTPEANPEFWEGLNGEPYFDRLRVPVQIYHGTNDPDVPYDWSTDTLRLLQEKNKTVELITYEGEGHEFSFAWEPFMQGVQNFTKE